MSVEINYQAPPTCAHFMKSDAFGRLIAGPVGSGKTTACIFELLRRSLEQEPADDGLRYTRWAIVRQTLKQLKDTVLKDITGWLGDICRYKESSHTVYIEFGDVRSEWLLIPLDDKEDQRRLLSMQLTGAWMSECIEMKIDLVSSIAGRCGRYPAGKLGGASWMGIIADTNMPSEGSDWHKFMTIKCPPDWQIFIQPGGLEPIAENLENLTQTNETRKLPPDDPKRIEQGRTYYQRLANNNSPDWIRRYVDAKFGNDPSGSAVFRESFKAHTNDGREWHVVGDLQPIPMNPLIVGQDFGRDPWSVVAQMDHRGRLRILAEVEAEDIGLELHLSNNLRPALMSPRFVGLPVAVIGDPAGMAKSTLYEETEFDMLKRMGFTALPAPTNDLMARIQAVEYFMMMAIDQTPGLIIDEAHCPILIRALNGGYRFGKTKDGARKPKPDKNNGPYSHVADALQYAALAAHGGLSGVIARRLGGARFTSNQQYTMPSGAWT